MTINKIILALGACTLMSLSTPALADNHGEEDDNSILSMMHVKIKTGHESAFGTAHAAYSECLKENGADSWNAWRNVGGEGLQYIFTSTMEGWAEMGEPDEAGDACWPDHGQSIMDTIASYNQRFARRVASVSGDAEDYTVVRLHHFRVDDGSEFRSAVREITGILKENDYEHLGTWYDMIANDSSEADYFRVTHYADFADMDADRKSAYSVVEEAVGEERADELWDQFSDALRDDWEYATDMWRLVESMSYTAED